MYIVFEENAAFRLGLILSEEMTAYMIELKNSRRLKLKKTQVLATFDSTPPADFLVSAQELSAEVDVDLLWSCLDPGDYSLQAFVEAYYGKGFTDVEMMAVLYVLHHNPRHFYKRGKGQYRLATAENLRAAQAGLARKERERETLAAEVAQLCAGIWPYPDTYVDDILFHAGKQRLADKAVLTAAEEKKLSVPSLLVTCGALSGAYDYWYRKFMQEYGAVFLNTPAWTPPILPSDLPASPVQAFSIDDSTTTEMDDAFSVRWLACGQVEVGIHIAVPALGCAVGTDLADLVYTRMSTVYLPGDKLTMFPSAYITDFTLQEGRFCFALSLYLMVDPVSYDILSTRSVLEKVYVAANLRLPDLQIGFQESDFISGAVQSMPWGKELHFLYQAACIFLEKRESQCGHSLSGKNRLDYHFYIDTNADGERDVRISVRPRGQPLDLLVAEWMVMANWRWASLMTDNQIPIIYRGIENNKVRLSSTPLPHKSMGLDQYAWFTSPLRRYVDLQNQRQLMSYLSGASPCSAADVLDRDILSFQMLYPHYDEFQRTMERYWSLVWLEKRQQEGHTAVVLYDRQLVMQSVPLLVRVPAQQTESLSVGESVRVIVDKIDLWTLTVTAHIEAVASDPSLIS